MRVFEERQWFNQWWLFPIYLFLIVLPLWACYKWFILEDNLGNVGPKDWDGIITILILFPSLLTLLFLFRLHTVIDERGILYQFYPMNKNQKIISWAEIKNCSVKKYRPFTEFGGWGYKWAWKGTKAMTVKGNRGIQIELNSGKKLLIGTQKPEEAQRVINKFFRYERI